MAEAARPFDPVTGNWLPPADAKPPWDPEAPRRDKWSGIWNAMLALDMLTLVVLTGSGLVPSTGPDVDLRSADVVVSASIMVFLLGIVPFVWVVATRQGRMHGAVHYLKLEHPGPSLLRGAGLGLLCLVGSAAFVLLLQQAGYTPETSEQIVKLGGVLTLPLALFLATAAAVGEEIFFRGILQRWLGVWGQAALFGLVHLNYGTPLQVVVPFGLGLVFGFLVKRGARLWLVIAAHFTFDFVQFLLLMYLTQNPAAPAG